MIKKSLSFFVNQSMRLYAEVKNNVSCVLSATDRKIKLIASLRITSLILGGVLTLHAITKIASPNLIVALAKISVAALLVLFGLTGSVSKKVGKSEQPKPGPAPEPAKEPGSVEEPGQELEQRQPASEPVQVPEQKNVSGAKIEIRSQRELTEEQIIQLGGEISGTSDKNMDVIDIQKFLSLGGKINYVSSSVSGVKVYLKKEGVTYYTGCSAGKNRSTATYGFLYKNFGIMPAGVFAGHESAFNPFGCYHFPNQPEGEEQKVFKDVYQIEKPDAISPFKVSDHIFYEASKIPVHLEKFYQDLVENFSGPTHIIAFSGTFSSSIFRLLNSKKVKNNQEKPLTDITITFLNWDDTIKNLPMTTDMQQAPGPDCEGAFELFNKKLQEVFILEE